MNKKTALITGSAKGLGKKTAIDLANEGINIVINYRNSKIKAEELAKKLRFEYNVKAMAIQADVSKEYDVKKMVNQIVNEMGNLDILIHNAGPFIKEKKSIVDTNYNEWSSMVDGNFKSFFNLVKEIIPIMRQNYWGRVITIGFDQVQNLPGWVHRGVYAAAKTAAISLSKTLSREEANYGITFNTVSPGDIFEEDKEKTISDEENKMNTFTIPRKEYGEDISHVIKFLCEEKSSYITGTIIPVTGNHDIINKHIL